MTPKTTTPWAQPTTVPPPRTGLVWNGADWVDPPTGRVWRKGLDKATLRQHLAAVVNPHPTRLDRDVARLLHTLTD